MSYNPFKWFKRAETIEACIWNTNATETRRCKLTLTGEVARDLKTDRTYNRAGRIPIPTREGGSIKQVYHFDEETGGGVEFQKAGGLLTLQTDPDVLHNVIDTNLLAQIFGIEASIKMVVMGFAIGFLLAGTIFGMFG